MLAVKYGWMKKQCAISPYLDNTKLILDMDGGFNYLPMIPTGLQ